MNGRRGRPPRIRKDGQIDRRSITSRQNAKNAGAPLKYNDPEKMQRVVDTYFEKCEAEKKIPLMTGLALALNMPRQTLQDYMSRDRFSDIIKKAKLRIEAAVTDLLVAGQRPVGAIFYLKNCHNWVDKTEVIQSGPVLTDEELAQRIQALLDKLKPAQSLKVVKSA
jgi:hypothetical protein